MGIYQVNKWLDAGMMDRQTDGWMDGWRGDRLLRRLGFLY